MAKRTEEERKAWKAALRDLAGKVKDMSAAEREALWERAGTITAEGRRLSVYNTCFLVCQTGEIMSQVGGFRQWKKAGRMVRKGEHACGYIYVPCNRRKDADPDEDKEDLYFRLVPVFSIDQTDPIEQPAPVEQNIFVVRPA